MTNFDFLKSDKNFSPFADAAIAAELIYNVDTASSVINCRRAMEFGIKWMYTVDSDLKMPYQDQLLTLISTDEFRGIVGKDIHRRLEYIRKLGNLANHSPKKLSRDEAKLALKNLHVFMDFIAYSYGSNYTQTSFNESLLNNQTNKTEKPEQTIDF